MIPLVKRQEHLLLLAVLFISSAGLAVYFDQYWLIAFPFSIIILYLGWQYREFVFLLLLFTLPFSIEYQLSPNLGTDIPDEFLMWLVSFVFGALLLFKPRSLPLLAWKHPLLQLLLIWFGWMIVSSVFSTQPVLSLKYLLAKSWYMGAFLFAALIVFQNEKNISRAAITLVTALLMVVLIILARHYDSNFRFVEIHESVIPFFRNHVNYSAFLVCMIPVLFALFPHATTNNIRLLLIILIVVFLAALFFSYARGAWVALVAGIITYWLIRKKLLVITWLLGILFIVGGLLWLRNEDRYLLYAPDFKTTIYHENFGEHLTATYKLKDVSTAERFYRWIAGVRMIKDNPVTGYGPNTFYINYKPYTVPAYKTWVSDNKDHSTVHNYFLLIAIEQGIPGLIIFLFLIGAMLYYAQRVYHRTSDKVCKTIAITVGVITVMIIGLNFLSDLIETDKIGSLFFLCLSLLIISDTRSNVQRVPQSISQ